MVTMLNCDCMDYMRGLPDKAFDLAIVDPPYGIGNFVQISGNIRGKAVTWNDAIPDISYFNVLKRVTKKQIIWGSNYYGLTGGQIVWWKHVPPESNLSECEIAYYSGHSKVAFIDLQWQNIHRGEPMIHPCQKPVALYKWLLSRYAKPGDRILDTHGGSGSICIACHDLGFDLTWMELDKDYYDAAVARYKTHAAQAVLFEPQDVAQIEQKNLFTDAGN